MAKKEEIARFTRAEYELVQSGSVSVISQAKRVGMEMLKRFIDDKTSFLHTYFGGIENLKEVVITYRDDHDVDLDFIPRKKKKIPNPPLKEKK